MSLKLNVSKETFLSGLSFIQNITGKRGTLAILANVLIKTNENFIELIGTDLEVGVKYIVPAEIIEHGAITLPSKILHEIVRGSGSESLHIEESDNNWVKIEAGSSFYNLAGIAAEEYPDFPDYSEDKMVTVSGEMIKELIDKTIFSVAQERESNFTLTGVLLEKEEKDGGNFFLRMVSSDGHRLSVMEKEVDENIYKIDFEKNIIIPKKGVLEIKKICEDKENVSIGSDNKQIVVKTDNKLVIIRLMNGDFPDYRSILNVINKDNYVEIDRKNFLESLKRTNLFTEDTFNAVQLDIDKYNLILSSQNTDYGNATDKLKVDYSGEPLNLGFNCKYFIDTLQVMESKTIKAYINYDQSPCLIEGDDDKGFVSIIMPMKI